jgi:sulfane dehydrogenase subunit SoxC
MTSHDVRAGLARRTFLGALAAGSSAATLAQPAPTLAARLPGSMARAGGADVPYGQPSLHEAAVQRTPSNHSGFAVWRTPLETQRGIITPSGLHFAVHHSGIPEVDPQRHSLRIHGLVQRPLQFDVERLLRYPMVSRVHFLECAGNSAANALSPTAMDQTLGEIAGEVSCSEWTGVPLSYLLKEAGLKDTARWVVVEGLTAHRTAGACPCSH